MAAWYQSFSLCRELHNCSHRSMTHVASTHKWRFTPLKPWKKVSMTILHYTTSYISSKCIRLQYVNHFIQASVCGINYLYDENTDVTLTLNQCTLAGPVYTGMPLVDPVYTGIPLEKLSWNSPTLECHWRNLVESAPHWDATGETLTFAAYTGTPLEGLWQPTHAPTHIIKHAE